MTPDEADYLDGDERETCWHCHGEGGFHDCGEDTCCCADNEGGPNDYDWYDCPECQGRGWL